MGTVEHRRSERVLADLPVLIRGQSAGNDSFQEETFTVTVNAHGALLMLSAKVAVGQTVTLVNCGTPPNVFVTLLTRAEFTPD